MARNTYKQDENLEQEFDFRHLLRAWVYIKKYSGKMALALILSAFAGVTGLISPIIVQHALDEAIPAADKRYLLELSLIMVGVFAISTVFSTVRSGIMVKVSQNIIYDIRKDLFEKLQKLPFSYYDDRPHGKILIRVVNYVNSVSDMLSNGLINVILEIFNLIFIVIFMFMVDVQLATVVMCGVPVLAVFMFWVKNKQRKAWQAVSNKNSNLNAYLQENIVGVRITQIFAREEENSEIFRDLSDDCRKTWISATGYSNVVWPGIDSIAVCIRAAIFVFGILLFGAGEKTVGTVVAISGYASRFWQPLMNLGNIFNTFINNIAYLERIFETLDEPVEIEDAEDATELPPVKGTVEFQNVCFSYEPEKPVLTNVSFKITPGESVALVGPTGAGKSTIVSLISRFYDVNSGRVLIDGCDVSKVTLHSLRSQMGIMLQDSFIFSGTIADNIRYGKTDATEEQIRDAAKVVCADDFIMKEENGYDSEVRERGSLLSQGQKQLISFARTLISDPAILVLDEATASIDVQTEHALQTGLDNMMKGRTTFIIAHRLSTIKNCDRIMYIDKGGITEQGTHDELMAKRGDYYRLYTAQLQEVS
ncbi:MAG: ABC transporter ATP-binding protein [Lachnospiraceae bacterium]|nr:ABC transporter ATP-binding protein [Lachnospiraceae bacterium]MBR6390876.1 ABC transporter ATP-binding protein [Lachnospiraceae bacterium]